MFVYGKLFTCEIKFGCCANYCPKLPILPKRPLLGLAANSDPLWTPAAMVGASIPETPVKRFIGWTGMAY